MQTLKPISSVTLLVSPLFVSLLFLNVALVTARPMESPFTPRAYLIRYWNKAIQNDAEKPSFLLSKASPLSAVDSAAFAKLAAQNSLSTRLLEFCSSANLLCSTELGQILIKHEIDSNFTGYLAKNFTSYGAGLSGRSDSFKNYSVNDFRIYSHKVIGSKHNFTNYGSEGNPVDQSFNSYATAGATDGTGDFKKYGESASDSNLRFKSYSSEASNWEQSFTEYSQKVKKGGQESFTSYSRKGTWSPNDFTAYGDKGVNSKFSGYGEEGSSYGDKFKNYGVGKNDTRNDFNSYGDFGVIVSETFSNYRDQSNMTDDSFTSYARNATKDTINFVDYGHTSNNGSDKFTGYGKEWPEGLSVGFSTYGKNSTFKDYAKEGINFTSYANGSSTAENLTAASGSLVKKSVEPGKFFRESMLKEGVVMPMPDIRDKMPKRSFLPRTISSKLPFATARISELKQIFHVADNSTMEKIILDALNECERAPSAGETKRCVGSVEDMIDFVTSVLGQNVVVRTTDNINGSNHMVLIGRVKAINGGKVTKSVSCHQSLYPYLLYYCHSVPKVRVYEADLLDPTTKAKINHGVAICHLDTSAWSPTHGAFVALGSVPGRVEVCHWIFQNDMTWNIAD